MALSANEIQILIKARDEASGAMDRVRGKAGKLGGMLKGALRVGAMAGGAALIGVGVASLKMGMDFEKTMAEVKTLMPGISEKAFGKMKDDVLAFSKEMGIATDKAVPALYQAISAGVPRENVMEFMTVASKAAIGGVTELETAVDGITSVINAYGVETLSAQKAADIMFTGVRLGKTTFDELSASLFNVVPMAAAAGISFEEIVAALARLTAQGVPTAQATTQLREAIKALAAPTQEQAKLMAQLGLDFSASRLESIGLVGAFDELYTATGGNLEQMRKLTGSSEALMAILGLSGDQAAAFSGAIAEAENATGGLDEAFETVSETTAFKFNKAINAIKVDMTKLGAEALPLLVKAFERLKEIISDVHERISPFIADFKQGIEIIAPLFKDFGNWILNNKAAICVAIASIGLAIVAAFGPASAAVLAITGIIILIGQMSREWEEAEKDFWAFAKSRVEAIAWMGEGTEDLAYQQYLASKTAESLEASTGRLARMAGIKAAPAIESLEHETARMRRTFIDTRKPIVDIGAAADGAGVAAGGAGGAFAGLSDELTTLREQMQVLAEAGFGRLNDLILAEEEYLARLAPVLADATEQHDLLKDALGEVEDQISDATDEMKEWEDAVLKGTRAFSDAGQALDESMNKINLAIAKIELGVLQEGLEDGGYASDTLSGKIKALARTLGLEMHRGKMDIEDVTKVLEAAGLQLDILGAKADVVDLEEKVKLGPQAYKLDKFFQDLGGYAEHSFGEIITGANEAALKLAALTIQQNDLNLSVQQQGNLVAFLVGLQQNHEELLARLQEQYANLGSLAEGIDPAIKAIWEAEGGAVISSIEEAFAAIDAGQAGAAQIAMDNALALFEEIKKAVAEVYPGAETVLAPIEALLKEVEGTVEIDVEEMARLLSGDLSTISSDLGGINRSVADLEKTTEYNLKDVFHSLSVNIVFLLGSIRNYTWALIDIRGDVSAIAADVATMADAPELQRGGYIARPGLYSLHAGETVVPASGRGGTTVIHHHWDPHFDGPVLGDRRQAEEILWRMKPALRRAVK